MEALGLEDAGVIVEARERGLLEGEVRRQVEE
jgi:hypothetical protein